MKEGFREALEKAILAKESFEEYSQITINYDWKIEVYASPSENYVHKAVAAFTGLVGKLEKKQSLFGSEFEFWGANDLVDVRITTPEQCKIVGYRIEKRPKKVTVETAEIEEITQALKSAQEVKS